MKKEDWEYSIRRIVHLSRLDDLHKEFQTRGREIEKYKERFESNLQELGFTPEPSYVMFMEKQRYRPHPIDGGDRETMETWEAFLREVFINKYREKGKHTCCSSSISPIQIWKIRPISCELLGSFLSI